MMNQGGRIVSLIILSFFSVIFLQAKKILVTGGAGFIGSHVCQALLSRGDSVIIIDNFNNAYDEKLKEQNSARVMESDLYGRLKMYRADICDKSVVRSIFQTERPEIICHLAARAGVRSSIEDPHEYFRSNLTGTLTMFEMAHEFNIKHVVFASSSSVYGARDDEASFCETDVVAKQSSPYGMTKCAGELLSYVYHHLFGISVTCLRFFTVYGPRGRVDMAPFIFMDAIYNEKTVTVFGDGTVVRDFTYVADIVDGVVKSIDTPLDYLILNLGRGEPIVLSHFIETIENIVGKKAKIEYANPCAGDVPRTYADITRARNLIGYNPHVSIFDGISAMYEWYKKDYLSYKNS